jgi:hypothetical protein
MVYRIDTGESFLAPVNRPSKFVCQLTSLLTSIWCQIVYSSLLAAAGSRCIGLQNRTSTTNFDYQLQLPISTTNFGYQLQLPISATNFNYQFRLTEQNFNLDYFLSTLELANNILYHFENKLNINLSSNYMSNNRTREKGRIGAAGSSRKKDIYTNFATNLAAKLCRFFILSYPVFSA